MRLSRASVLGLIAVLVVGALGTSVATAGDGNRVRTKVTIRFNDTDYRDRFSGKVRGRGDAPRAVKRKCAKKRKVVVFRKTQNGKRRIGADRSNRRGRWVVNTSGAVAPGRYFAKAKRKRVRHHGETYRCKKGKSRRIRVE